MKRVIPFGLAFFAAVLASCGGNKEIIPSVEFTPYINAYSGGMVSSASTIRVELASPAQGVEAGEQVKGKLFKFKPSIKGQAYWVDEYTVEFRPEEGQLKVGTMYNAAFKLGKVMEVPSKLSEFKFSFRVTERDFTLELFPSELSPSDRTRVIQRGELVLSEAMDEEVLAAMLRIGNQGPSLIEQRERGVYLFTFDNLERKEKEQTLYLEFYGRKHGFKENARYPIVIPALTDFSVTDCRMVSPDEGLIEVTFSDLLDEKQSLSGLVTVDDIKGYKVRKEGNKAIITLPGNDASTLMVRIDESVKSVTGSTLPRSYEFEVEVEAPKPMVSIQGNGALILPDSKNLLLPFTAVNLAAVDLTVVRIFPSNVLSFLQVNTYSGSDEIRRVARPVLKKTIRLDTDPTKKLNIRQEFALDMSEMFKREPGAIYRIKLSFKKGYSLYPCDGEVPQPVLNTVAESGNGISEEEEAEWDRPNRYYYGDDYDDDFDWSEYNWRDREDPCTPTYYMVSDNHAYCNVLSTNLGVIAKSNSEGAMWVAVSDMIKAGPVSGAHVKAYNYQLQVVGEGSTDGDGIAKIEPKGGVFAVVATSGNQTTVMRMVDGEERSVSRFDVGGRKVQKGLKGFIYGERGVWRPGDTIHLCFILDDVSGKIPASHPVTLELYNARDQFASRQVATSSGGGFYRYDMATDPEDPTGMWNAYVKVGGVTFHKGIRVETVKPNRLKINLDVPNNRIDASGTTAKLHVAWLTGATASGLEARIEASLSSRGAAPKGWESYVFNNPATEYSSSTEDIYDGNIDSEGNASVRLSADISDAPGLLRGNLVCRVFEPGGDASIMSTSVLFSPYNTYVGLKSGQVDDYTWMETNKNHAMDVVTVDADGKAKDVNGLQYKVYKIDWSWWWERSYSSLESYINSTSVKVVASGSLNTKGGKGSFNVRIDYPQWGRYLVYVKAPGGHATGSIIYLDWPSSYARGQRNDPSALEMLTFSSDKKSYQPGQEAVITIPATGGGGRALVSLENGSKVLSSSWVECAAEGDTRYKIRITEEMAPNFYVHVSLLQPHGQNANNLPIRLYGVIPIEVSNPGSELKPVVGAPESVRPQTEFKVEVSEQNGQDMTYTLAIVDEGLLDITGFKTPNPWNEFFAREALGIKTWDMYNYVVGAYTGRYAGMFAIGGDQTLKPGDQKANRFKPVVKFLGPFNLGKGKKDVHKVTLPMYVGSVKAMVVAGKHGAYGCADKNITVKLPLMILPTLPRVVSVGEKITMPVNVFAMENSVSKVTVKAETSGLIKAGSAASLSFSQPGDKMAYISMEMGMKPGIEKVVITATGGGETVTETIEIDVRNPNPFHTVAVDTVLKAGQSIELATPKEDMTGGWSKFEISSVPSVDFARRFAYLEDYYHNCTEQITSKGFPQLYAATFKELSAAEKQNTGVNVRAAIRALYGRQLSGGGFTLWPGGGADEWVSSYAGNFLIEAKEKGYEVNPGVLDKWRNYQQQRAREWNPDNRSDNYSMSDLQQAYRLYTLVAAGAADQASMNRLRESKYLTSTQARWRLAAAYALDGKLKVAQEILASVGQATAFSRSGYSGSWYVYGSPDRDDAMVLETQVLMGDMTGALKQAKIISKNLSTQYWFSPQSTAFSLIAMGRFAAKVSGGSIDVEWSLGGGSKKTLKSSKPMVQQQLEVQGKGEKLVVTNRSGGDLFLTLTSRWQPLVDKLPESSNDLKVEVSYKDMKGNAASPQSLVQGTDLMAEIKVTYLGGEARMKNIALTHIVPSGWEIFNERLTNPESEGSVRTNYTYLDIRDDRVLTYFDLDRGGSKTFKTRVTAAYAGRFVMPAVMVEAMYDPEVNARTTASTAEVSTK